MRVIRSDLHVACAAIWLLIAGMWGCCADAAEQREFAIPAGPADAAVRQYVEQAGMSVIYEAGRLNRFKTRAVEGKYEPLEALRLMLAGTGLEFSQTNSRFISVRPQRKLRAPGEESDGLPEVDVSTDGPVDPSGAPRTYKYKTVTGQHLAQQGFITIPDFIRTLTANQGTGAYEGTSAFREAPTNIAFGSGLNLFGVGQRATLVLVNGRRLAPSGSAGSYTDILNLPITLVERVEFWNEGASTIYGADAVGGVVNFVLRDGYSRSLSSASIGHLTKGDLAGNDFSQSYAKAGDGWRGVAAIEYYDRSGLPASDRRQATSDLTQWGGTNFDTSFGNPASIRDIHGHYWGIPAGQNGTSLTPDKLLSTPNLYDTHANTWILPRQQRLNAQLSGSYDLSERITISLDTLLGRREIKTYVKPLTTLLSVPSSNPFYVNPVAGNTLPVQVLYGFGKDFGPITESGTVASGQLGLGLDYEVNNRLHLKLTEGYTFDNQSESETNLVDFNQLATYLAAIGPAFAPNPAAVAFNPFGDGSYTNPDTLAKIRTTGSLDYRSAFETVSAQAIGSVPLPTGSMMTLTAGYDFRQQTFRSNVSTGFDFAGQTFDMHRQRALHAGYVQAVVPVASGTLPQGSLFDLDLTTGWRYEHFSDSGSTLVPSFGFSLGVSDGWSFTGTWARLFRPPNLPDLNESLNYAAVYPLADPKSATGTTTALVLGGNNAHLSPETAHSWMLGLKYAPESNPDLSLNLQYYNIVSFNQVIPTQTLPLSVLSDPQYSYLYTRNVTPATLADICSRIAFIGAAGQCQNSNVGAIVDLRLRSAQTVRTDGLDLDGQYGFDTNRGRFSLNLQATFVARFKEAVTPESGLINYRNTPHNPLAWRVRGILGWENGPFRVNPAVNFQGRYTDNISVPSRPVRSWTTVDLIVGYKLAALDKAIGGDSIIALNCFNLFNRQPPFLNNDIGQIGYDPENANLLGRRLSLLMEHRW